MDLDLRDRRALVTGSSEGIGFAIAPGLAAEGASVVLDGRTNPVYLHSPRASATTGAALRVDRGVVNGIS